MRKIQPRHARPSALAHSVEHQLNLYALAGAAAGVGILAIAQQAEAKIIYHSAKIPIRPNSKLSLDLNHDRVTDFTFVDWFSHSSNDAHGRLSVQPAAGNGEWPSHSYSAAALRAGVRIGPSGKFRGNSPMAQMFATFGSYVSWGPWVDVRDRYLGLKFAIQGKIHYGWARLSVSNGHKGFSAVVTGYAYETVENKPIITGKTKGLNEFTAASDDQPTTLGRLALGRK